MVKSAIICPILSIKCNLDSGLSIVVRWWNNASRSCRVQNCSSFVNTKGFEKAERTVCDVNITVFHAKGFIILTA